MIHNKNTKKGFQETVGELLAQIYNITLQVLLLAGGGLMMLVLSRYE